MLSPAEKGQMLNLINWLFLMKIKSNILYEFREKNHKVIFQCLIIFTIYEKMFTYREILEKNNIQYWLL